VDDFADLKKNMTTYKMIKNASSKYNVYLYDINLELLSQSKRSK